MIKKIFTAAIILLGIMCSYSFAGESFTIMHEERIGALRIGLSEGAVKKKIHCALKRGPEELWDADGAYHQKWEYVGCGITLGMVSEKKGASKSIESISLVRPSVLRTKRGIRIGSTEQEVMKVYKSHWNREESKQFGNFVAGTIYGGLLFYFENGKVSRIFFGAAAE